MFPQGNYNQAMAVDPLDPSIIYVGGTADGNQAALIRVDLTDIWDAHSLVAFTYNANNGGELTLSSTGPATIASLSLIPPLALPARNIWITPLRYRLT